MSGSLQFGRLKRMSSLWSRKGRRRPSGTKEKFIGEAEWVRMQEVPKRPHRKPLESTVLPSSISEVPGCEAEFARGDFNFGLDS